MPKHVRCTTREWSQRVVGGRDVAYELVESSEIVDWNALSALYAASGLQPKTPADLETAFSNSRYVCFAYEDGCLVGAGRALADGVDCAYIADLAVDPGRQGSGIGSAMLAHLLERSRGHRKIVLYTVPGKENFYRNFGFRRMRTAMAVFDDQDRALRAGLVDES